MRWGGYFTSEQFRRGTEEMFEVLKQHNSAKVLGDIKEMVMIAGEDQKWLEKTFLPNAVNNGFKVCAIIRPKSHFSKVAIETVTYKVDQRKLAIRLFDTREEAEQWLEDFQTSQK